MRKVLTVALAVGVLAWTAAAVRAQGALGGLGDAVKKNAGDAAKQQVNDTVGVPGAADKMADPNAAAKQATDDATDAAKARAAGAVQGAVGETMGGMKKAVQPPAGADEPQ